MRRAWLPVIAIVAVVAALAFATCDERPHDPSNPKRFVGGRDAPAAKPIERRRGDAPVAVEKPEEAPQTGAPSANEHEPKTWFYPSQKHVAAPRHVLRGRVVNRQGEPVADADVTVFSMWLPSEIGAPPGESSSMNAASRVRTGADGAFALTYFEGGPRSVLVERKGARRLQLHGLSDDRVHELVVDDAAPSLLVHVTRSDDGSPVTEADVALIVPVTGDVPPMIAPGGWTYPDVKSIGPGTWRISQGPVGPALLTVRAPGLAPETERRVEMRSDREDTIEVVLKRGATVRGVVVDAVTGAPIAGAHVERPQGWYAGRIEAESEADGRFALEDLPLPPRTFVRFTASAKGYAKTGFLAGGMDVGASECEATVRLVRAATLVLRCVDADGRPITALVAAFSAYDVSPPKGMRCTDVATSVATSDAESPATFDGVHPGTEGLELRLRFYVDGVPVLERSFPPLAAGETRDLGDVVLAPALTLRGVVLDADGEPVAGATVGAAPSDPSDALRSAVGSAFLGRGGRCAETGPDGAFTLMGLTAGLWDVYGAPDFSTPGRLELGVDPRVQSVTLRLPRVVALEGRIVDSKGAPVAGAVIEAKPDFFGMRTQMQQRTLEDGRFSLPGFAADAPEFDVAVVATKGAEPQTFKVRPGVAGTELRLRP